MKKYIVIIFFTLFCISSFLGGVYFNNFINNWDLLILTFGLLGFYLCLLENKITKELFLLLFFIILVPLIFFSGLSLIDNTLVSLINDWIGFLGAYFGVIGAIGGIWWQLNEEKRKQQLGFWKIALFHIDVILSIPNEKYIQNILAYFFLSTGVNSYRECLLISDNAINFFNSNLYNVTCENTGLDFYKMNEKIKYIESIFLTLKNKSMLLANNFNKIFEETMNLSKDISLKKRLFKLRYTLSLIKPPIENKKIEELYNFTFTEEEIKDLNSLKDSPIDKEKIISISKEISVIANPIFNLLNEKDIYKIFQDCSQQLRDVSLILFEEKLKILFFDNLKNELKHLKTNIENEINKLS